MDAKMSGACLERALADRAPNAPPLTYSGTALMGGVPIIPASSRSALHDRCSILARALRYEERA